ncbi:MAG: DUF4352 domain-containing protein [Ruminiclostridium sp.]|nr:DUF4352 domain-containing protein [Ruminiclostridium sp.]MBE5719028.1 DUF4352 domain-containing protein [Ruminiclostridium sp.]
MDVFCDYCGAKLDVEHENCCTQCGAPFDNNASVKAYREEKKKKEEEYRRMKEMRQKEYEASQQQSQSTVSNSQNTSAPKVAKIITTTIIILFFAPMVLGLLATVIGTIVSIFEDNFSDNNYGYIEESSATEESSVIQEVQRVNFNETAQTDEYSFICDEVFRTDIMYGGADKGYMYVAFHLKVKNTTDEKQWLSNDLNCVYDGDIGCDRAWGFNEGKSFSTSVTLSAGIGSDGYVCYIVPEKAKSVVLSYGDYVRVNIDLRDLSYRTESSQTSTDNT